MSNDPKTAEKAAFAKFLRANKVPERYIADAVRMAFHGCRGDDDIGISHAADQAYWRWRLTLSGETPPPSLNLGAVYDPDATCVEVRIVNSAWLN